MKDMDFYRLSSISSGSFKSSLNSQRVSESYLNEIIKLWEKEFPNHYYSITTFGYRENNFIVSIPVIIGVNPNNKYHISFILTHLKKQYGIGLIDFSNQLKRENRVQIPDREEGSIWKSIVSKFSIKKYAKCSNQVFVFAGSGNYSQKKMTAVFKKSGYTLHFK